MVSPRLNPCYSADIFDIMDQAVTTEALRDCGVMIDIDRLLQTVVQAGASDVHLAVSSPPVARVNGALKMVQGEGKLTQRDLEEILQSIITREHWET